MFEFSRRLDFPDMISAFPGIEGLRLAPVDVLNQNIELTLAPASGSFTENPKSAPLVESVANTLSAWQLNFPNDSDSFPQGRAPMHCR